METCQELSRLPWILEAICTCDRVTNEAQNVISNIMTQEASQDNKLIPFNVTSTTTITMFEKKHFQTVNKFPTSEVFQMLEMK